MASKPFVTHSLQDDGAWNFAWYYASLRSPGKFSRTWTAEDEDKDKDKDFSSKDKDKDLKIGPRGSSRTRIFLEDNNTVMWYCTDYQSCRCAPESRNKEDCHFVSNWCPIGVVYRRGYYKGFLSVYRKRQDYAAPRPLLKIQLGIAVWPRVWLWTQSINSVYKLKDAEAKCRNVAVAHDMTRNEGQKLVNRAKERNEQDASGNWFTN